jgi:hypothetical protein
LSFGQTLQNKSEVLLGTSWGTNWELGEPFENMMKLIGDKKKNKKFPLAAQVLSVLVGPCWQGLGIHLRIQHLKARASFEPYHEK